MAHAGSLPYTIRFTLPDGSSVTETVPNFEGERDTLRQYREEYGSPVTLRSRKYQSHGGRKKKTNPRVKLPASWTPAKVRVTPSGDVQIGLSKNPMELKGGRVARGVKKVNGPIRRMVSVARRAKRKTLRRVGVALRKHLAHRKNPGMRSFAVTIPPTRYDKGYRLTIKAKTKSAARSEAKRYCSTQWSKYTGKPASQYKLPSKTKVVQLSRTWSRSPF